VSRLRGANAPSVRARNNATANGRPAFSIHPGFATTICHSVGVARTAFFSRTRTLVMSCGKRVQHLASFESGGLVWPSRCEVFASGGRQGRRRWCQNRGKSGGHSARAKVEVVAQHLINHVPVANGGANHFAAGGFDGRLPRPAYAPSRCVTQSFRRAFMRGGQHVDPRPMAMMSSPSIKCPFRRNSKRAVGVAQSGAIPSCALCSTDLPTLALNGTASTAMLVDVHPLAGCRKP